jgi:hypothetical protein
MQTISLSFQNSFKTSAQIKFYETFILQTLSKRVLKRWRCPCVRGKGEHGNFPAKLALAVTVRSAPAE